MKPNDLDDDQRISIDAEPLSGATFRVSDMVVKDIGLTAIVGVTLVSGCERYAIEWATHSDTAVVSHLDAESADSGANSSDDESDTLDGDSEWEVPINAIQAAE